MRLAVRACFTVALCLAADVVAAQYTPPGGPDEIPGSRKEAIEKEIEAARYRLGPVRIAPWFGIRDVAWIETARTDDEAAESDLTATVGAGLRGYLRTSDDVVWFGHVLPEYVYWQKDEDRRSVQGRYRLGVYSFLNHLTLEAAASREDQQQIVTPELLQPSRVRHDIGQISAELLWSGAFSTVVSFQDTKQESLISGEEDAVLGRLETLDREERTIRVGARLRPRPHVLLGAGAERYEAQFETLDRSNSGTSPFVEARFDRPGLSVQTEIVLRSLEAESGSRFVSYENVTGNALVALNTGGKLETWIYGGRSLVYSLIPEYAYLDDQRLGAALRMQLGWRTRGRFFVESGDNDYTAFTADTPRRRDDQTSFGGVIELDLGERTHLSVQAVRTDFDSSLAGFDRSFTSIGAALNFGGR